MRIEESIYGDGWQENSIFPARTRWWLDYMAQGPSFGKSYEWGLQVTDSLSKNHSWVTFENTWRVLEWWVFADYNDRSRRHFEFQTPYRWSSQWSNKSTALVTCEHPNHEIKDSFTTTRRVFHTWYILQKTLAIYWTHCQWILVLLEEREKKKWKGKKRNFKIGDIVIAYHVNVSRNHWPMARVIGVKSNKKGLVHSVLLCMEEWSGNENSTCELEQPIDKIVLILGNDEVWFPNKKAMCWDKMNYLKGSHVKLHHEGVHSELCLWRRTYSSN